MTTSVFGALKVAHYYCGSHRRDHSIRLCRQPPWFYVMRCVYMIVTVAAALRWYDTVTM